MTGSMPYIMLYILLLQLLWTPDNIDFPHLLAERLSTSKSLNIPSVFSSVRS